MMKKQNVGNDRLFYALVYIIAIFAFVITLWPFLYIVAVSFSGSHAVYQGEVFLWPVDITLDGYRQVFKQNGLWTAYGNTLFYTTVGTVFNLAATTIAAYPLSRNRFFARRFFNFFIAFTMYFSGGIIPFYFTVKDLGLDGSLWSLILPTAISTYNLIIMRTAFAAIPDSLEESAKIDGARHFTILFRIMLPLCIPTVAVLILYYAVGYWNSWFNASLFLTDRGTFPLQLILREIILYNTGDASSAAASVDKEDISETLQYATIIVSTVPILCIYPFLQKYFAKGVMVGAIKG